MAKIERDLQGELNRIKNLLVTNSNSILLWAKPFLGPKPPKELAPKLEDAIRLLGTSRSPNAARVFDSLIGSLDHILQTVPEFESACQQSISAILLVAVYGDQSKVWGTLHPEPAYPLNIAFLPDLPFVRIAQWPVVEGKILTEWVVAGPSGHSAHHLPVRLPRATRRGAPAPDPPR